MKRETGYYWVQRNPDTSKYSPGEREWEIGYYENLPSRSVWLLSGFDDYEFKDDAFCKINETRILNPDEK